jgi:hypothetical protein
MHVQDEFEVSYENEIYVEFYGNASMENDGIGSYEYWGIKGYDKGQDYWMVEEITWDKEKYTEEQNKIIEKYLEDNWDEIHDELCDIANDRSR